MEDDPPPERQKGHPPRYGERVIKPTLSLRTTFIANDGSEEHVMRDPKFTAVRSRMVPLAALVLVTALGGCVGYSSYPSGDYGYAYPNSYYAGHPRTYYTNSYSNRPYYSPYYSSYNNAYGGNN